MAFRLSQRAYSSGKVALRQDGTAPRWHCAKMALRQDGTAPRWLCAINGDFLNLYIASYNITTERINIVIL